MVNNLPLEAAFFILPAFLAAVLHHFWIIRHNVASILSWPIDCHLVCFDGEPLFGSSKTGRGFITMMLFTGIFTVLASFIYSPVLRLPAFWAGLIIGLFYSLGELPNSFIKRRLHIAPGADSQSGVGRLFKIADQLDSVVFAAGSLYIYYNPSTVLIVTIILIGTGLHFLGDQILHKRGYKKLRQQQNQ